MSCPSSGGRPRAGHRAGARPISTAGRPMARSSATYPGFRGAEAEIFTCPVAGGPERQITFGFDHCDGPDYTPDGKWIWFNGEKDGAVDLWRVRPDGERSRTDDRGCGGELVPASLSGWKTSAATSPIRQVQRAIRRAGMSSCGLMPAAGGASQVPAGALWTARARSTCPAGPPMGGALPLRNMRPEFELDGEMCRWGTLVRSAEPPGIKPKAAVSRALHCNALPTGGCTQSPRGSARTDPPVWRCVTRAQRSDLFRIWLG